MVYEIQTIIRLMIVLWMIVLWMIVSYPNAWLCPGKAHRAGGRGGHLPYLGTSGNPPPAGQRCSPRQQGAGFAPSCHWWHWMNHDFLLNNFCTIYCTVPDPLQVCLTKYTINKHLFKTCAAVLLLPLLAHAYNSSFNSQTTLLCKILFHRCRSCSPRKAAQERRLPWPNQFFPHNPQSGFTNRSACDTSKESTRCSFAWVQFQIWVWHRLSVTRPNWQPVA